MTQKASDAIDVGIRVAREFGFPVLALCAVLFMAREAAIALHASVLVPAVKSHTDFLEVTHESLKAMAKAQENHSHAEQAQAESMEKQANAMREIAEGQKEITRVLIQADREREK